MYASVMQFKVDFRGDDFDNAQAAFERTVLPEMRRQPGYEGCYLLKTGRGAGLLISLWEDEAAAQTSGHPGPLLDQKAALRPLLGKVVGEQTYQIAFADHPVEPE